MDAIGNKIKAELEEMLKKIDDRPDFTHGVILNAGNPENWQRIINFIKENPDEADAETVSCYAVLIDDMTEKPYER